MTVQQRQIFLSDSKVANVAQEIEEYVDRCTRVADTAEGFANWWLPQQRFENSLEVVRAALESLVKKGVLDKRLSGDNVIYVKACFR